MGCGKSKDANESKTIEYTAKEISVPDVNSFFKQVENAAKILEEIRSKLEDSKDKAIDISGALKTKDEKERFEVACEVFLWAVSAANEGQIAKAKPQSSDKEPYLTIDVKNCIPQTVDLHKFIMDVVSMAPTAPAKFDEQFKIIKDAATKADENLARVKEAVKDQPAKEKFDATSNATANALALAKLAEKIQQADGRIKAISAEVKHVIGHFPEFIGNADKVGAEAGKAKKLNPAVICADYYKEPAPTGAAPK